MRVSPWPPGAKSSGRRWKLSHDHSNNGQVTFITNKYDVFLWCYEWDALADKKA